MIVGVTCDNEGYASVPDMVKALKEKLWDATFCHEAAKITCMRKNEGFMDASRIQYVSRAGNFKKAGFAFTGALRIFW